MRPIRCHHLWIYVGHESCRSLFLTHEVVQVTEGISLQAPSRDRQRFRVYLTPVAHADGFQAQVEVCDDASLDYYVPHSGEIE